MSDSALDRELQAALHVEPSPEFLARVRMRVASEPARTGWTIRWPWLAAGAAAAVIAIAVTVSVWRGGDGSDPRRAAAPAAAIGSPRTAPAPPPVAPAPPTVAQAAAPRAVPRSGPGADLRRSAAAPVNVAVPAIDAPPFPEVLISPDEVRAYELFVAAVQQRRLPPMPPANSASASQAVELPDLEIAPLIIEPLPQIARLEIGERQ